MTPVLPRNESRPFSRFAGIALALILALQSPLVPGLTPATPAAATTILPVTYPALGFGYAGTPQWNQYEGVCGPAPSGIGCASEPTFGVAWNLGKGTSAVYENGGQVRLDWDDSAFPPPATGAPMTSTDVTSLVASVAPDFDPILYTDHDTGRTFAGGLVAAGTFLLPAVPVPGAPPWPTAAVGCSALSYSDDNGATWTPMADPCSIPGWDHETVGAGPWASPAPVQATYPSAVYYCSQDPATGGFCWVSYDGGATFTPTTGSADIAAASSGCGGLHGHIRVSRSDGTAYLPNKRCDGETSFAATQNNGDSWDIRHVDPIVLPSGPNAPTGTGWQDPSVGISIPVSGHKVPAGHDGGNSTGGIIYVGQTENDPIKGGAFIGVSNGTGLPGTWLDVGTGGVNNIVGSEAPKGTHYFNVGAALGIKSAMMAEVIAGDDDRAAFAFLGSTTPGFVNPQSNMAAYCATPFEWNAYVATTYDQGKSWTVTQVNPATDPVQRGGIWPFGAGSTCRNLLDFGDIVTDAMGRILLTYEDGCTASKCGPSAGDNLAAVWRQTTGRGLFKAFDVPDFLPDIPVPDPCKPTETPEVDFTSPASGALITSPSPSFAGFVDRHRVPAAIVGHANGDYFASVGQQIPLIGSAHCFGALGFTCLWSDDLTYLGRPALAPPLALSDPFLCGDGTSAPSITESSVTGAVKGTYQLKLVVTDPVDLRTATVTALLHISDSCTGLGNGFIVDEDGQPYLDGTGAPLPNDHKVGAPPSDYPDGMNEITCVAASFDGVNVHFRVLVPDLLFPTENSGTVAPDYKGAAMEYYWVRFAPDFGAYSGLQQTIEVQWDGLAPTPTACFLILNPALDQATLFYRSAIRPNPGCDPNRPITSTITNTLAGPDAFELSFPISQIGAPVAGSHLKNTHAYAWHWDGSTAWQNGGNAVNTFLVNGGPCLPSGLPVSFCNSTTVSACFQNGGGGNCGKPFDDDFAPSCASPGPNGAVLVFPTPTTMALQSSCNALYTGWMTAPPPILPLAPSSFGPAPASSSSMAASSSSLVAVPTTPTCLLTPVEYVILVGSWSPTPSIAVPVDTSILDTDTWLTATLPPLSSLNNGPQIVLATWCGTTVGGATAQVLDTATLDIKVSIQDLNAPQGSGGGDPTPGDTHGNGNDADKDTIVDRVDNCPSTPNTDQVDLDKDGIGDACDQDIDGDGINNNVDNCVRDVNPDHHDTDFDGLGDKCDTDIDGDGVPNATDNCQYAANAGQTDSNKDGVGDACQGDRDGDGVPDYKDYFPDDPTETADSNHDGLGDNIQAFQASRATARASAQATVQPQQGDGFGVIGYGMLGFALLSLLVVVIAMARRKKNGE